MGQIARGVLVLSLLAVMPAPGFGADTPSPQVANRAEAYFNYSMGHLYAELAASYGNRGEYFSRAIEYYKAAMKADPTAAIVSEALAGLYIQAGKVRDAVTEIEDRLKKDPNAIDARRVLARLYARLIGDPQTNRINEEMLKRAIEQYRKIVEIDPKDLDSWLLLGRLFRVSQDSVESEKAFQKALSLEPDNEEALTELALVYSSLGDNRRAIDLLEKVAGRNPNRRTLTTLAGAYEELRDFAGAAQVLRRALELEPDNLELKRGLAQDLLYAGKLDEALQTYTEVAAGDPKDAQTLLRISQIHRRKRDFARAREALEAARKLQPEDIEIRYSEVTLLDEEGKRSEALAAMKQLLASSEKRSYNRGERSSRAALLERLAALYRSDGQYSQAVDAFRQMADLDQDLAPRASAQVIDTYRQARDFARASEEADAALKKFPTDRMVVVYRALLLADLTKGREAVAEARKLLGGQEDRDGWLTVAQVAERAKDYDEMSKALDAVEKLSVTESDKGTVHFMRGAMHERRKDYAAAEAEFRKALALDPDNAGVLNYLGYMFADRGERLEEALRLISRAVELEPASGAYLDSLGWVYFKMGRLEEAETYLRRSLELVPNDPTIRDHLGDVLARQGKLKEAVAEWQASLNEWEASAPVERDAAEIAKVSKKLEGARLRLAQETSAPARKP
ncbi:MAG TPA: tetratricopeptide repeat protein [Bryobacteraceae bacterium]|nr:tetratricopeptide repeat protein [Bryobacteraceae bacterium]